MIMIERILRKIFKPSINYSNDGLRKLIGESALNSAKSARGTYKYLWDSEVKVFSQWGEDGILDYLFDISGISKPKIIEFGVGNFDECNSRFAAEHRNASVYAIDMRTDLKSNISRLDLNWKNEIFAFEDFITPESAKKHFEDAIELFGKIDLLSIDIDGNDYWILESLDLSKVDILVCEYNPIYGSKAAVTILRKDDFDRSKEHPSWLHYGMSLMAAINVMERNGLVFVGSNRVGNNAFFVNKMISMKLDFKLPNKQKLDHFVDWRIRESRNLSGELNYLFGEEKLKAISKCKVLNLETNSIMLVGKL